MRRFFLLKNFIQGESGVSDNIEKLKTFSELLEYLENWHSVEDPNIYDFGGIVQLWLACLNNIKKYAVEGELEDLVVYMENEEREFLSKIAKLVAEYKE